MTRKPLFILADTAWNLGALKIEEIDPIPMPKYSGLLKRKGRFSLNVRVPKDLLFLYVQKKIIRKSLVKSDC